MTFVDRTSRKFAVTVSYFDGSNPLDITDWVNSISLQCSDFDYSGIESVSGRIELAAYPIGETVPNPRINKRRWAEGNLVVIDIADDSGTLQRHPRGYLQIVPAKAQPPLRGKRPTIEINVGCALAAADHRDFPDNASDVTTGVATTRTAIINSLAARAGLPALIDEIPDYPISHQVWQMGSGWVQLMGALAFTAGYQLWIDKDGDLRAKQINRNEPQFKRFVLGQDDADYDETTGSENPPHVVQVSGVSKKIRTNQDPDPNVSVAYASTYQLFQVGSLSDRQIKERLTSQTTGLYTKTPSTITTSEQPRGVLYPTIFPNDTTLTTARIERQSTYYASNGRKIKDVVEIYQPLILSQPTQPSDDIELASRRTITPFYQQDAVIRIVDRLEEQSGVVTSGLPVASILEMVDSETQEQVWEEYGKDGWKKITTAQSFGLNNSSSVTVETSGSGGLTPPAPEYYQEPVQEEDELYTGRATFPPQPGALATRPYEYQAEDYTLTSDDQAAAIAQLIGADMNGRDAGVTWSVAFDDSWFDYEPLLAIDWVDRDGYQSRYWVVSVNYSLNQRECTVSGGGVNLGLVQTFASGTRSTSSSSTAAGATQIAVSNPGVFTIGETITIQVTDANGITSSETRTITGISGSNIQFAEPLANGYGSGSIVGTGATETLERPYFESEGAIALLQRFFTVVEYPANPNNIVEANPVSLRQTVFVGGYVALRIRVNVQPSGGAAVGGTSLYTGDGSVRTETIDLGGETVYALWLYERNNISRSVMFYDSVRGAGYRTGISQSEYLDADSVTAFGVDSFDLGVSSDSNNTGADYLAYAFANSGAFQVVTWSGTSGARDIAITMTAAPTVAIVINRSFQSVAIYHESAGNTQAFDSGSFGLVVDPGYWDDTSPTASVLRVGSYGNTSGSEFVAYLLTTEFGTYTGNGADPGASVTLTQEPSRLCILSENASLLFDWLTFDSARNPSNPRTNASQWFNDLGSYAETTTGASVDWDASSFTPNDNAQVNESGRDYYWFIF